MKIRPALQCALALTALAACVCAQTYDVLILGAGIAGIRAARELYENNVTNILIIEQADRIGGRMHEVTIGSGSGGVWRIEKGANWVEGYEPAHANPIWEIGQAIGLEGGCTRTESDLAHEPLLYDQNGLITDNLPWAEMATALANLYAFSCKRQKSKLADMTMREALTAVGWPAATDLTPAQVQAEWFICDFDYEMVPEQVSLFSFADDSDCASGSEFGSSAREFIRAERGTLPRGFGRRGARSVLRAGRRRHSAAVAIKTPTTRTSLNSSMVDCSEYFVTDQRGFTEVVRHVAKAFINNTDVFRLNSVVTSIASDSGQVTLSDGTVLTGSFILTTFSAAVVNHAFATSSLFSPPLPQRKVDAFAEVDFGVYMKIFFQFPYIFWDRSRDYSVWVDPTRRGYYSFWQNLERDDNTLFPAKAGLFMVTIVTQWAVAAENQTDAFIASEALKVLGQMYADRTVPAPTDVFVPRWHSDPAFLGSYSNMRVGASTTAQYFTEMQTQDGVHFFAGEHTDYDHNGFVEGAYNSGIVQGKKILAALGRT